MAKPRYIGNDIVDLDEPSIVAHHCRERFIARVCAPSEREALARSADPKILLWSLFAAKEAAFKLATKELGPIPFAHRAFVVSADLGSVCYGASFWPLKLDVGIDWVHALVCSSLVSPFRVDLVHDEPASDGARAVLVELAAKALGLPAALLSVVRPLAPERWGGFGPPRLLFQGEPTDVDVSLSHDGRFVAAALAEC
jgi:phosphopantetheinyl transferase (holo-ACP synthase)